MTIAEDRDSGHAFVYQSRVEIGTGGGTVRNGTSQIGRDRGHVNVTH